MPLPKMPLSSIFDCIYCVDRVHCVALIVLIVENRSVFAWFCYLPLPKIPSSSIFDRIDCVDCVDRFDCVDCVDRIDYLGKFIALIASIVENALFLYIAMLLATAKDATQFFMSS